MDLEFLDSAPSFADTAVQDTEAVDSTEVPSATPVLSNMIAVQRMAQRSYSRRRQVADIKASRGRGRLDRAAPSACGEKDGPFTGEIILPVDFLATLGVTGKSQQINCPWTAQALLCVCALFDTLKAHGPNKAPE